MENKPLDPWNLLENTVSLAVELYTTSENWTTGLYLQANQLEATWCEHKVQAPNYTHIQEEEQ